MYAARIDQNHPEIVNHLELIGCSVQSLASLGNGVPDIIVGYQGINWFFEIKTLKGKLNDRQVKWHGLWDGQVDVIRSVYDAMDIMYNTIILFNKDYQWNEYASMLLLERD